MSKCYNYSFSTTKGKGTKYSGLQQLASPLWELTYHTGSHSVTCHTAEVIFTTLPQTIKTGTRFNDPKGMQF